MKQKLSLTLLVLFVSVCLVTGADDYRPYCLWMIGIKSYRLTMGIVVKWIAEMCAARVKRGQECHRLIGRAWYIGSLDRT